MPFVIDTTLSLIELKYVLFEVNPATALSSTLARMLLFNVI